MSSGWGDHFQGAERARFVKISEVLKQYWFDAQCEYLASRLVEDGYRLVKIPPPRIPSVEDELADPTTLTDK